MHLLIYFSCAFCFLIIHLYKHISGSFDSTCLLCIAAQTFQIRRKFINGNLKLKWANISTNPNDITVTKDGFESNWTRIYDDKYTVEDVWLYKSVNIRIREYTGSSDYSDYNLNYSGKFYTLEINCSINSYFMVM